MKHIERSKELQLETKINNQHLNTIEKFKNNNFWELEAKRRLGLAYKDEKVFILEEK